MITRKFTVFILLLFSGIFIFSQTPDFSVKTLSLNEGLSQGSNYFRFEDQLGFMWLSANDAINRFDGSQVKVYNLNRYFEKCPNLAQAYGISEDAENNMYFGSTNGLYCYSRQKNTFHLLQIFSDKKNQLTMPFGFWNNKIWCFNNKFEISSFDVKTQKISFLTKLNLPELSSVHVYNQNFSKAFYQSFPVIIGNKAWFCTKNKVLQIDLKTKKIEEPLKEISLKENLEFNSISYTKENKKLLFATNKGLLIDDFKTNNIHIQNQIGTLSLQNLLSVISNGNLLVLFRQNNLTILKEKTREIIYQKIKNFSYYQFGFDKNDRLWFCDDGKGQLIFDFGGPLIQKATSENTFTNPDFNGVATINSINENELLINSNYTWNKNTKTAKKITGSINSNSSFRSSYDQYRKGIWLYNDASFPGSSLLFMDENKNVSQFASSKNLSPFGKIQDLKALSENQLLLATEIGLIKFDIKENKFTEIPHQNQKNAFYINPLSENRFAISYINHDMLLVKKTENGDFIFEKNILPGKQSFYMQEDIQKENFWVGTNNGLYLLDKNFNILKTFDANSEMAGTYIYGLLKDDLGNIWVSHQRCLSSINASTFQVINYDLKDGVQDWDFNNRSFCKTPDGTLYFGGAMGFNYFKPPLKHSSNYHPKIYIDEIQVNSKIFRPDINPDHIKNLNFKTEENNISLKVIISDLGNAESYKIAYRIDGKKWILKSNSAQIDFTSLSPKTYELELAIYDKFTNKYKLQKRIVITIKNPFYKTIGFWIINSILITGLLFYLYNRRKYTLQKRKFRQKLELEHQRNKITADLHDDLGASLSSLQINSAVVQKLFDKNPAEAKKILKKIESQAKGISENIGDIIWSLKPSKDEFMSLSTRIKKITSEILGSSNIKYKIKIDELINEEINDFSARKNIILICKEALNNILKHSDSTKAELSIEKNETHFRLQISDNGTGFKNSENGGNGLTNMKKRAEELGAKFEISINNGTSIIIDIPRFRE
ncbi:sensor histidine kinase [Kaistella sp. G5-32]|uniref:histidine kinase n=1 Tax=Kaistella gelatinilytica TaxID=2787636 RepID=A0ABS0F8D2_9FLAO|nr:sensor histidine kinase [Kaistella gelatinilytica]MBF8455953.1 sensor histidine kinase [Kaistella gelatinilytica]